jgi:hypothetical protein
MSENKRTIPSIPTPSISGHPQSHLDWNVRLKPAGTPRREYAHLLPECWMLLAAPAAGTFGPTNSGVIQ